VGTVYTYQLAGLTSTTIDSFKQGLFDTDKRRIAAEAEAEKRQEQIDALIEERDAFATQAEEQRRLATEVATLLADRFAAQPRYSLALDDNGEDDGRTWWEIYDLYNEETVECFGIDEAQTIAAHDRLDQLQAERSTNLHEFETVDYWVGVTPRES
jgi:hypothetical protein